MILWMLGAFASQNFPEHRKGRNAKYLMFEVPHSLKVVAQIFRISIFLWPLLNFRARAIKKTRANAEPQPPPIAVQVMGGTSITLATPQIPPSCDPCAPLNRAGRHKNLRANTLGRLVGAGEHTCTMYVLYI